MKLRFTNHAKYRIFTERRISTEEIKFVINNPEISKHLRSNLTKSTKKLDKGTLVVIYSKERKDEFVIITAYFKS